MARIEIRRKPVGLRPEQTPAGSVLSFFRGAAFDPLATQAMGKAFDLACQHLKQGGQPEVVKEIMAKRIIQAAENGERDPNRLAAKAMDAIGLHFP